MFNYAYSRIHLVSIVFRSYFKELWKIYIKLSKKKIKEELKRAYVQPSANIKCRDNILVPTSWV